jgi:hypothetical protein
MIIAASLFSGYLEAQQRLGGGRKAKRLLAGSPMRWKAALAGRRKACSADAPSLGEPCIVFTSRGAPRDEQVDAASLLGLIARSVDFAAPAHPHVPIEQYLWPGLAGSPHSQG